MDDYLYNRLPNVYRVHDEKKELKRFLEIFEDGFNSQIGDTGAILDLIDINRCPDEYIPFLCNTLGIKYEPNIPISYQRRFLNNAVKLNKRKGTTSAITYLVRELTGFQSYVIGDNLYVDLDIDMDESQLKIPVRVINNYIKYYTPVFMDLYLKHYYSVTTKVETQKHFVKFLLDMKWSTNPWTYSSFELEDKFFDGKYLFDGILHFEGNDYFRKGAYHNVDLTLLMNIKHSYKDKINYLHASFDGSYKFGGKLLFNEIEDIENSLIKNKVYYANVIESRLKPFEVDTSRATMKKYKSNTFNGDIDFSNSNSLMFDGAYKLEQSISL